MDQRIDKVEELHQRCQENVQRFVSLVPERYQNENGNVTFQVCGADLKELAKLTQVLEKPVSELYGELHQLTQELLAKVQEWLGWFQFQYSQIAPRSDSHEDLNTLSDWCGRVGKILYDWNILMKDGRLALLPLYDKLPQLRELYRHFMNGTFVITKQESFYIKPLRKTFPEFEARVLAASLIPRKEKLTANAYFVTEKDVKFEPDIKTLQLTKTKLENDTQTLKQGTSPWVFVFKGLHFKTAFKRKQVSGKEEDRRLVYEEKYRVLFKMVFDQDELWTWSLPMTVNTGSNQEDGTLASVMWQCFSTNVFHFPTNVPKRLPWSDVAEMLCLKMKKLSPRHNLTKDNLEHLKQKLLGNKSDDDLITLRRFCQEPIIKTQKNEEVTFWKWFLGIYNLIDRHLLPYWENGLITGFIGKKEAQLKLAMKEVCHGTFILRFSDTIIANKDGIATICGYLTAVVKVEDTSGKSTVVFNRVCGHEQLKNHSLAHILKGTLTDDGTGNQMYLFLHPSNASLESTFCSLSTDKDCNLWRDVLGYNKPKPSCLIDIGSTMENMSLVEVSDENDNLMKGDGLQKDNIHGDGLSLMQNSPNINIQSGKRWVAENDIAGHINCLAKYLPPEKVTTLASWFPNNNNMISEGHQCDEVLTPITDSNRYGEVLTPITDNNQYRDDLTPTTDINQHWEVLTPTTDNNQYREDLTPTTDINQHWEVLTPTMDNNQFYEVLTPTTDNNQFDEVLTPTMDNNQHWEVLTPITDYNLSGEVLTPTMVNHLCGKALTPIVYNHQYDEGLALTTDNPDYSKAVNPVADEVTQGKEINSDEEQLNVDYLIDNLPETICDGPSDLETNLLE